VVFADTVFFSLVKTVITINGEPKEIVEGLSISQLLEELNIRVSRVVIELNRDIVSREAYGSAILKEGDTLEIVHFVGGG
jgi:thiamine biosynthesis protein ThiS